MHDHLLEMTSRSLVKLEDYALRVEELLIPTTAASGTNAGKPPSRRGSKPPLSVAMLDLKVEMEQTLVQITGAMLAQYPGELGSPESMDAGSLARWIRVHLPEMESMPGAELAAEQILAMVRHVADVVDPPPSKSDPTAPEVGTAREIARWCVHLGAPVSRSRVQRWIGQGALEAQRLPDGRQLVRLADVLGLARGNARF